MNTPAPSQPVRPSPRPAPHPAPSQNGPSPATSTVPPRASAPPLAGADGHTPHPAPPAPSQDYGPGSTLRVRFLDAAGFECELELWAPTGLGVIDLETAARKKLAALGCKPIPRAAPSQAAPPAPASEGAQDAPRCKYHGGMMKPGKGGKWFCPRKIQGGGYCDYTVDPGAEA